MDAPESTASTAPPLPKSSDATLSTPAPLPKSTEATLSTPDPLPKSSSEAEACVETGKENQNVSKPDVDQEVETPAVVSEIADSEHMGTDSKPPADQVVEAETVSETAQKMETDLPPDADVRDEVVVAPQMPSEKATEVSQNMETVVEAPQIPSEKATEVSQNMETHSQPAAVQVVEAPPSEKATAATEIAKDTDMDANSKPEVQDPAKVEAPPSVNDEQQPGIASAPVAAVDPSQGPNGDGDLEEGRGTPSSKTKTKKDKDKKADKKEKKEKDDKKKDHKSSQKDKVDETEKKRKAPTVPSGDLRKMFKGR